MDTYTTREQVEHELKLLAVTLSLPDAEVSQELLDKLAALTTLAKELPAVDQLEQCRLVNAAKGLGYTIGEDGMIVRRMALEVGRKSPDTDDSDTLYMPGGAASCVPTEEQLARINQYSYEPMDMDGVYTFPIAITDMSEDADGEHLSSKAIDEVVYTGPGSPYVTDHKWEADEIIARCYGSQRIGDTVVEDIFVPAHKEEAVQNLRTGLWSKASIAFGSYPMDYRCDSCKGARSIFDEQCPHKRGGVDRDGRRVTVTVDAVRKRYEGSIVMQGKNRNAGVVGTKGMTGAQEDPIGTITPSNESTIEDSSMTQDPQAPLEPQEPQAPPATEPQAPPAAEPQDGGDATAAVVEAVKAILPEKLTLDTSALDATMESIKGSLSGVADMVTSQKALGDQLAAVTSQLEGLTAKFAQLEALVNTASNISVDSLKAVLREQAAEQEVQAQARKPKHWFAQTFLSDVDANGGQE